MKMPGKIQAIRELPATMKQVYSVAMIALVISIAALLTSILRSNHAV